MELADTVAFLVFSGIGKRGNCWPKGRTGSTSTTPTNKAVGSDDGN